jgi:hypothetical protein
MSSATLDLTCAATCTDATNYIFSDAFGNKEQLCGNDCSTGVNNWNNIISVSDSTAAKAGLGVKCGLCTGNHELPSTPSSNKFCVPLCKSYVLSVCPSAAAPGSCTLKYSLNNVCVDSCGTVGEIFPYKLNYICTRCGESDDFLDN